MAPPLKWAKIKYEVDKKFSGKILAVTNMHKKLGTAEDKIFRGVSTSLPIQIKVTLQPTSN